MLLLALALTPSRAAGTCGPSCSRSSPWRLPEPDGNHALGRRSIHHTILLWPLPAMVMASPSRQPRAGWAVPGFRQFAVILAVLVASDVLVTNEYFWKSVRNGRQPHLDRRLFPLSPI